PTGAGESPQCAASRMSAGDWPHRNLYRRASSYVTISPSADFVYWTGMELKEVLAQVPGLEKRFVYYLESLGYIQPARVPKLRIARRDYAQADVQRIQELWRYYQQGYALQAAQALVARPRHRAYV